MADGVAAAKEYEDFKVLEIDASALKNFDDPSTIGPSPKSPRANRVKMTKESHSL